uniref:Uncharacterized protein n=1 Tax=Chenopodium quinoa TaxID=63459 RepID=A0A803LU46_CHEQI
MADSVLYGIAQEVLKNLGSTALTEIASAWGFKARLEKLNNTINTLKDVLLDAENKQADSRAVRDWLERLTAVVYAADDLFDEFVTVAARFAFRVSREIKTVREKLDEIVRDSTQFNFVLSHEEGRVMKRPMRDQTYSFVDAEQVIGRDDDKKVILDMLLASSSTDGEVAQRDKMLPVITIVGMGGMGKTTLAKLIFNDPQVEECFEMKLWVCVSDVFDIKDITENILKSATNKEIPKLEMEQLQGQLRNQIGDKKYLLVLDDVWNEIREKWLELRDLLKIGRKGSKIVVTARSRDVAEIMGTFPPHELQGLSEEKSWELFKKMAFNEEAQQNPQLLKVGKEIAKKCGKLPLAIRTVGSLLYGLWSPLKNCFAYCSLFPKNTGLKKEILKELWMAEGFIIPEIDENQSLDEAAEDYFQTLLQRGFFQDIRKDEWGAITYCKMHDLAQEPRYHDTPSSLCKSICQQLTTRFSCLRVLDLRRFTIKSLPNSIVNYDKSSGVFWNKPKSTAKLSDLKELNNLRGELWIEIYRDFEMNMVEEAMEAKLTNKQGLIGLIINFLDSDDDTSDNECNNHDEVVLEGLKPHSNIRKLRIEDYNCQQVPVFSQLRFLKRLQIEGIHSVEYMENGVCDTSSSSSKSQGMQTLFFPSLEALALRDMKKLKGWWKGVEPIESTNDSKSSTLSSALVGTDQQYDYHQSSMQFFSLSKLLIKDCPKLKYLPHCPKVEVLKLIGTNERLSVLKMATPLSTTTAFSSSCSGSGRADLKFKGLKMDNVEDQLMSLPKHCLHRLSSLSVESDNKLVNTKSLGEAFATLSYSLQNLEFINCGKLRSISQGLEHLTALEKLSFWDCEVLDVSLNEQPMENREGDEMMPWKAFKTNLRSLEFVGLPKMVGLPSGLQHLTNLHDLKLIQNHELREIPESISCLSSLQLMVLRDCPKLTCLPEALRKLTSLNKLVIQSCQGLTKRCRRPNGLDCPKFQHVPTVIVML